MTPSSASPCRRARPPRRWSGPGPQASVEVAGIHSHIGSQVFEASSFAKAVAVIAEAAAPFEVDEISIGGGLGVPYVSGESAPTIAEWGEAVHEACRAAGVTARVTAEPGRAIAAGAAVTLYTVGTIKTIEGVRTYVAVDGGMSDNPRPVLYGSGYEAFLPRSVDAPRDRVVTVVGKHCESGDTLVRDAMVPVRHRGGGHPGHARHRRLRALHGLQLQQGPAARSGLRRRWRGPPAWSAARPTTTCWPANCRKPDPRNRATGSRASVPPGRQEAASRCHHLDTCRVVDGGNRPKRRLAAGALPA